MGAFPDHWLAAAESTDPGQGCGSCNKPKTETEKWKTQLTCLKVQDGAWPQYMSMACIYAPFQAWLQAAQGHRVADQQAHSLSPSHTKAEGLGCVGRAQAGRGWKPEALRHPISNEKAALRHLNYDNYFD